MTIDEWERTVPDDIRNDPLWRVEAYRLASFACDRGFQDARILWRDPITRATADQLFRALGSVTANLEEGYSRSSGRDRVKHFEYSLGSARESRGWYWRGRFVLGEDVAASRIGTQTSVVRLLLASLPGERQRVVAR